MWRAAVNLEFQLKRALSLHGAFRSLLFITFNHSPTWAEPGAGGGLAAEDVFTRRGCGGRCAQEGTGLGATAASTKAREGPAMEGMTGETLVGLPSLAPLPRTSSHPGREGTEHGKERKQPELSNEGVLKILIQDEMCACLCTTHFPPQWRALSATGCLHSARPAVMKAACASSVCGPAVRVHMLGSKHGLDGFLGLKRGKNNKEWKKTPPNRGLAPAGMMSSGQCSRPVGVLVRGCEKENLPRVQEVAHASRGRVGGACEGRGWTVFSPHNCILFA